MKIPTSKRIQEIVELLEKDGFVKAKDLSAKYSVSMETIRKDLTFLEEKGVATKEYGGASICVNGIERSIEFRKHKEDEKKEIGRYVSKLLKDHHSLILDSGSTCNACCTYINLLGSKDIFTNSLDAIALLYGDIHNVFILPGKKREKNQAVVGNFAETFLDKINVDVCILGTSGLLNASGPTSHSYQEISLKQKMIERSDLVFVLADSSKFNEKGLHTICSWDQIDGIITDHLILPAVYEKFNKLVPVYVAREELDEKDC